MTGHDPLAISDLCIGYHDEPVIAALSLSVRPGASVALVGPSGSGKSSVLRCVLGLLAPSRGTVTIAGEQATAWTEARWRTARLHQIGFVPQDARLLDDLTVLENVELPMLLGGQRRAAADRRGRHLLGDLGLATLADRFPTEVSGGQRQRAALARALANEPALLLADEPTGSLDRAAADQVADLVFARAAATGGALVIATHDPAIAERVDQVIDLAGFAPPLPTTTR